jgi:hypothetical protein
LISDLADYFDHLLCCVGETLGKSIADAVSPMFFARVEHFNHFPLGHDSSSGRPKGLRVKMA